MSCTIGIDFGTLSGRAVVVDTRTGEELGSAVCDYPHGVMDRVLCETGQALPPDFALQDPDDYLEVLRRAVPQAVEAAGISPGDVVGIGIDFTACTVLPVKRDGTPLCFLEEYRGRPHAYVKLWKHHAAQRQADELNRIAAQTGQPWLWRYGGKISSEWVVPKVWQMVEEDGELYRAMDYLVEAADWVVWQLTGKLSRNACTAGYKAIWNRREGFPSPEFFEQLHPALRDLAGTKLAGEILPVGKRAGGLSAAAARMTGLLPGTAVAVANVDAHVTAAAVKIDRPGIILAIMGTSTCHVLLGERECAVPGMCGVVEDGVLPGYFGYEAGQSCVGDHFAWFVEKLAPAALRDEAEAKNMDLYQLLEEKLADLRPGASGLVALDWWNGNRSVLVDVDLTGLLLGMTLHTRPEEIYRALVEATAYGTRMIIENFRRHGVPVDAFYASGGISWKSPAAMQIYADVLGMPVHIAGSRQGPALGSAIFGAVAAGGAAGGWDTVEEAERVMGKLSDRVYRPEEGNCRIYDRLFEEYRLLHDYFGRGGNNVMKRLKELKRHA